MEVYTEQWIQIFMSHKGKDEKCLKHTHQIKKGQDSRWLRTDYVPEKKRKNIRAHVKVAEETGQASAFTGPVGGWSQSHTSRTERQPWIANGHSCQRMNLTTVLQDTDGGKNIHLVILCILGCCSQVLPWKEAQATLGPADKEQIQLRETVDTYHGICLGESRGREMRVGEWRAG